MVCSHGQVGFEAVQTFFRQERTPGEGSSFDGVSARDKGGFRQMLDNLYII